MKRYVYLVILLLGATTLLTCKKVKQRYVIKGDWELMSANVEGDTNLLKLVLSKYSNCEGNCRYLICFEDKSRVMGYYYTYDTLDYSVEGEWEMVDRDKIFVRLDHYVDGYFEFEKTKRKHFLLYSPENYVKKFKTTLPVELHVRRF